jgi:hypothetical protein
MLVLAITRNDRMLNSVLLAYSLSPGHSVLSKYRAADPWVYYYTTCCINGSRCITYFS